MIMLADWHPDIIEFIISKMQNPNILRHIINTTNDEQIKRLAQEKLKFEPLSEDERDIYILASAWTDKASQTLKDGGRYSVNNPDFLTNANISVAITKEFMEAVENDEEYTLRFPDVENYDEDQMVYYNEHWHEVGDVREWRLPVKTYRGR